MSKECHGGQLRLQMSDAHQWIDEILFFFAVSSIPAKILREFIEKYSHEEFRGFHPKIAPMLAVGGPDL